MNDFLHSLRTGKDKRYDRNRRGPDNAPYRSNDRHSSMDKRKRGNYNKSNAAENAYLTIAKLLPPVKTLLETMVANNKAFLEIEERKALAMETIALHLQQSTGKANNETEAVDLLTQNTDSINSKAMTEEPEEVQAVIDTTPIDMMRDMRTQGFSYDKIARQLDMDNIPTPSGRGKWRGQVVSKLLKK
jgi:hypothetical protein